MHTITVSILGGISVAERVEVNDGEVLPLFIKLKSVLQSGETPKPGHGRGRPRKDKTASDELFFELSGMEKVRREIATVSY